MTTFEFTLSVAKWKQTMNKYGRKLRLAYYDASDGPRIMIFGPTDADVLSLQTVFKNLSLGQGPFELDKLPFIVPIGGIRILSMSTGSMFEKTKGKCQGLSLKQDSHGKEFEWRRTNEGWDYLARFIDEMVRHPGGGHQYLTAYPNEAAIIVLSTGEYDDTVLEKIDQNMANGEHK